ncbi:MAG: hypothetical protein KA792_03655 [Bacteroidales bacterium]|nr:hypothetical protein [Bacteroidales bacterium]
MRQDITYNAYNLVETIKEKEKNKDNITNEMKFYYGPDEMRKMVETYKQTGENELELQSINYYSGAYEKEVSGSTTTEWTYIYGATGLAAVYRQVNGAGAMYYALTDHLGSITGLVNENGELAEEYSYDAWGRRRKPDKWTDYTVIEPTLISRGYTGHEHLDMFGLINMNGRLYDPLLGRMLSPDNFVQSPMFSQSYNRFAYCVNNPLKYIDPSGENYSGGNPWTWFINLIRDLFTSSEYRNRNNYIMLNTYLPVVSDDSSEEENNNDDVINISIVENYLEDCDDDLNTSSPITANAGSGGGGSGDNLKDKTRNIYTNYITRKRLFGGSVIIKTINKNMPIINQKHAADCLPACGSSIDISRGGNLLVDELRLWHGGDPETKYILNEQFWQDYTDYRGYNFANVSKPFTLGSIFDQLYNEGADIAISVNSEKHSVVLNSMTQKIIIRKKRQPKYKYYGITVMDSKVNHYLKVDALYLEYARSLFYIW